MNNLAPQVGNENSRCSIMSAVKIVLLFFLVGSISAANLRDLAKRIYVGTCLGYGYMNESHIHQTTGQQFNMLTCENEMKWSSNEPSRGQHNFGQADAILSYAKQHSMRVRGHTLVWHSQYPGWLNSLDKNSLHAAMLSRIETAMSHYKGQLYCWDVVNEVFEYNGQLRSSIFSKNFGESFIADAFNAAKKADSSAKLYINDYGIEAVNSKSTGLYNLVKKLKSQGVPIEGVGFQTHLTAGQVPASFEENLRRFTALGVEVALTEVDIASNGNQQQQAKDYAKVFEICQNNNRCAGVTVWGWTDKYSWISGKQACMWDSNFQPKPAVAAVEAVLK